MAAAKKKENALEDVALVAGTQQNLSNLYSLDIYGWNFICNFELRKNKHYRIEPKIEKMTKKWIFKKRVEEMY